MRKAVLSLFLCGVVLLVGALGASAQTGVRIAVMDLQVVMTESLAAKRANADLAEFARQRQSEIDELNAKVDALQTELASGGLSERDRAAKQDELNALIDELQTRVAQGQNELAARQQLLRNSVLNDIGQVLNLIGQERDYTVILDSASVFYYKMVVDITWEVVRRYDELYEAALQAAAEQRQGQQGQ